MWRVAPRAIYAAALEKTTTRVPGPSTEDMGERAKIERRAGG